MSYGDPKVLRLKQAIDGFLNDPPRGLPPHMLEGLNNMSEGLSSGGVQPESPGQEAARESAGVGDRTLSPIKPVETSPGHREAMALGVGQGDEQ